MTEEDVIRLVHQVQGQQEVNEMRVALEKNITALRELSSTEADHDAKQAALQASVKRSAEDFLRAEEAMKKAGGGVAGFGQSMMQAGRSVQDFQAAGLRGILNNIEGLTMAMGGGAGLAGALTLAAVGFETLKPLISGFMASLTGTGIDSVGDLSTNLEGLNKQIKELEDKPTKISVDFELLDEARKRVKEIQENLASFEAVRKTVFEQDLATRTSKAVRETVGGEALQESIRVARRSAPELFQVTESGQELINVREQKAAFQARLDRGEYILNADKEMAKFEEEEARLRGLILREQEKQNRDLVAQFSTADIGAMGKVGKLIGAAPEGTFAAPFVEALANLPSTPEEVRAEQEADVEAEMVEEREKENLAKHRKFEIKKKQAISKAVQEGEKFEEDLRKLPIEAAKEAEEERRKIKQAEAKQKQAETTRRRSESTFRKWDDMRQDIADEAILTRQRIRGDIGQQAGLSPVHALTVASRAMQRMGTEGEREQVAIARAMAEFLAVVKRLEMQEVAGAQRFMRQADNVRAIRTSPQDR